MWILLSPGIFLGDPVRLVAMSRCELGGASSWRESFRSFELAANAVPIILEHGARRRIRIQSPSPLARRRGLHLLLEPDVMAIVRLQRQLWC